MHSIARQKSVKTTSEGFLSYQLSNAFDYPGTENKMSTYHELKSVLRTLETNLSAVISVASPAPSTKSSQFTELRNVPQCPLPPLVVPGNAAARQSSRRRVAWRRNSLARGSYSASPAVKCSSANYVAR